MLSAMTPHTQSLGALLAALRHDAGLTQELVAVALGVTRCAIARYEATGATSRIPSPDALGRLLDMYDAGLTHRAHAWELRGMGGVPRAGEGT